MGVITEVKYAESWLLKHERIVIVLLVLLFGAFGINKIENVIAARDAANASALTQQVQVDKQNAAKTAQDAAVAVAQFQT
ncbi:MAG: hypothetical protein ACREQ5_11915, partial [Candidatus Dormibacteria bacterium]